MYLYLPDYTISRFGHRGQALLVGLIFWMREQACVTRRTMAAIACPHMPRVASSSMPWLSYFSRCCIPNTMRPGGNFDKLHLRKNGDGFGQNPSSRAQKDGYV
jgi:hypothetical protein